MKTRDASNVRPATLPARATTTGTARPAMPRVARYVVERGWLHVTLVCGAGVILLPFVWMITTSLKTDEELTEPRWFPELPTFRSHSPYVLGPVDVIKPLAVSEADWERSRPAIERVTREAVEAHLHQRGMAVPAMRNREARDVHKMPLRSRAHGRDAHATSAATVVMRWLVSRINLKLWEGDDSRLLGAYRAMLTDDVIAQALRDRQARFELRGVQLRALDGRIFNLARSDEAFDRFVVESGDASIIAGPAGGPILRYQFASPSAEPVVLRFDFDSPIEPQELHKLIFSYTADNSWHRIDATVSIDDVTWESQRTSYVAQHRPGSIIFQPPSFDDETYRARIWVPLERTTPSPRRGEGRGEGKNARTPGRLALLEISRERDSLVPGSLMFEGLAPHPNPLPSRAEGVTAPPHRASIHLTLSPSSTPRAIFGKVQWNYARAFRYVPFLTYVFNSLILVVLTTVATLFSSTFVAYAFARLRWPGRAFAFVILLSTMMLPAQVTMIPSFVIWKELGWYNTLNPLWVPALFGGAFFVFLMVQHMKTIPRELEEAARIDGLNALQTWWYIIVPLVKPAAAAIAIMTVMAAWNDFLGPLIYLRDQGKFPLSLGLFAVRIEQANDWTMIMAGNVLMTMPMVLMFVLFQRYFIQGMTMSGMKG